LAYTFASEDPHRDDIENLVELSFHNRGGSTELVLAQRPFKTEARRVLHRNGWTDSLDKLERFLLRLEVPKLGGGRVVRHAAEA
jgi:hypothetical protein